MYQYLSLCYYLYNCFFFYIYIPTNNIIYKQDDIHMPEHHVHYSNIKNIAINNGMLWHTDLILFI